ncbi:LOW QUALITY PROTEIN: hypothetical protein PAHAL_2G081200 [Panicum hallii]|uniref:F-box domain-containing protein n=1 Tax=Panicum hallii TaxID=206008 RepID=A0A2S3GWR9_9POAL|nr:LOW QUALITY PROTEIN: hypothetical protein PAHAL_2G081200 [Panicum hallii]
MGRRRRSNRKKARTDAGDGSSGDRITALPLELRAQIASLLSFQEAVQLSTLSRPWRHIHHHTPVVSINLYDFLHLEEIYFDHKHSVPGFLDERSILVARVALGRRAQDASASRVDALRLAFGADDPRMRRHAARIVALADGPALDAADVWTLDLPPAARDLEVVAPGHAAPAIAGPGAASLRKFSLDRVVIRGWPPLPSLRSLSLDSVAVEAPFAPGAWCPRLDELDIFCSRIEHARVDICLPLLRFIDLDEVDVSPDGRSGGAPSGEITIDAPELLELDVTCNAGSTTDYKSFRLRAPRLRLLCWANQFAERVAIDGRPGSVTVGVIQLRSVYTREMKYYREQMMRMLRGLLPDLPKESIAGVARPFMKLEECVDSDDDEDEPKDEKLTCDISALTSRGI